MVAAFAAVVGAAAPAWAAAPFIPVNTTSNNNSFDGKCSLVEAVNALNLGRAYKDCPGGSNYNVITLPTGTITSNAVITITRSVATIQGNGLTSSTITFGMNNSTGCGIQTSTVGGTNLTLHNLTVQQNSGLNLTGICGRGARLTPNGVRVQNFQNGGIIMTAGDIYPQFTGGLLATNIQIQNNHTFESGGGLAMLPGTSIQVTNISFANNHADGSGGGFWFSGSGNNAMTNCTFTGNQAGNGGGMYSVSDQYMEMTDCTFSGNTGYAIGGGLMTDTSRGASIHINGCILVSNTAPPNQGANFAGPDIGAAVSQFTLYGGPLDELINGISFGDGDQTIQQADASGEFTGLSNTGSPNFLSIFPLKTTAYSHDSSSCLGVTADERNVARPQGAACDKGSYER
jgi:parallel beta-helix repeat protein